ncbi:MAG: hypothetical protein K1000chlam3_01507 [Chlamydiae bacterium]|nr:hypothetical protein [Chlamydiota bacterium]
MNLSAPIIKILSPAVEAVEEILSPAVSGISYALISKFTNESNPAAAGIYALTNAIAFESIMAFATYIVSEVSKIEPKYILSENYRLPAALFSVFSLSFVSSIVIGKFCAKKFDRDFSYLNAIKLGVYYYSALFIFENFKTSLQKPLLSPIDL